MVRYLLRYRRCLVHDKQLARRAMAGELPDRTVKRPKTPLQRIRGVVDQEKALGNRPGGESVRIEG